VSANHTRRWLAIAPLVFWNWCQSPESLYRECLFHAAGGAGGDVLFGAGEIRDLCREAADYPTALEQIRQAAPEAGPMR
jgi:hypothetical protein